MAVYRIENNLAIGKRVIPEGSIMPLDLPPENINKLIEVGAISRIAAPPLSVLPGWEARSKRMAKHSIITVEDMLEADPDKLAAESRVQADTIRQWQENVLQWMLAPPSTGG